jgi:hypothetical protein
VEPLFGIVIVMTHDLQKALSSFVVHLGLFSHCFDDAFATSARRTFAAIARTPKGSWWKRRFHFSETRVAFGLFCTACQK